MARLLHGLSLRPLLAGIALLFALLMLAAPAAKAVPLDPTQRASEELARAWDLVLQRQRRGDDDVDPLFVRETRLMEPRSAKASPGGLLPLSFGVGGGSKLQLTYGLAGPDQKGLDPVTANLQGLGFSTGSGAVKSDSLLLFYRPELDGGAAATLVNHYRRPSALQATDASRLQSGRALRQSLELGAGSVKLTGRFQDIDQSFAPAQRLIGGGDAETTKRLQELVQQRGTQRTSLGLTAGLAKGWSLTTGIDSLDDGAGHLHSQQIGLTGTMLRFNTSRQDVDATFKGFGRFGDAEVQKLAALRGVQRRAYEWGFTPSKAFGFEGTRTTSRDAGGEVDTRTLGVHLGTFQFSNRERAVSGFKSFTALGAPEQTLQKIAGVTLRETQASLGLGGKTRLGFSDTSISDAGGHSDDRLYSLDSRTVTARARFREVESGFRSYSGLAEFDKQYAGLQQQRNQRQALYDLNYTGSKWLGLTNHYETATAADGQGGWTRAQWANGVNLNLGATSVQAFRSQTDRDDSAKGNTSQRIERFQVRRALQQGNFISAERTVRTDTNEDDERTVVQSDRVQAKLQVAGLFALDGLRAEQRATGADREFSDTLTLSRKLGAVTTTWAFRDRSDARGREEGQKLAVQAALWRGLSFTGSRETRLAQAGAAPAAVTSDARWVLTQEVGKAAKLSLGFARVKTDGEMQAGEQSLRLEMRPFGTVAMAADFTQRQAAGKPTAIVQGFSLVDEVKDRRWGWRAHYRRRSRATGQALESKGWSGSWRGLGKTPITLTASYLRNGEDAKGKALPGRQAAAELSAPLAGLTVGLGYGQSTDETTRKAEERMQFSLQGPLSADEKLKLALSTQRNFEAAAALLQRTRVETIRLEYSHGAGEGAFTLGGDLSYRTVDAKLHAYKSEYRVDVKWQHGFF